MFFVPPFFLFPFNANSFRPLDVVCFYWLQQAVQYVQVDPRTGMYTPVQSEPMTYQAQPANHINPMTVRHVPVSAVYPPSTNEGYHAPAAAAPTYIQQRPPNTVYRMEQQQQQPTADPTVTMRAGNRAHQPQTFRPETGALNLGLQAVLPGTAAQLQQDISRPQLATGETTVIDRNQDNENTLETIYKADAGRKRDISQRLTILFCAARFIALACRVRRDGDGSRKRRREETWELGDQTTQKRRIQFTYGRDKANADAEKVGKKDTLLCLADAAAVADDTTTGKGDIAAKGTYNEVKATWVGGNLILAANRPEAIHA